jgi:hypothetical protein
MKIISIDVGIKNLAYCLLELDPTTTNVVSIVEWDVINLCGEKPKCNTTIAACTKDAKYYIYELFFCNKHATETIKKSKCSFSVPPDELLDNKIKKLSKQEIEALLIKYVVKEQMEIDKEGIKMSGNASNKKQKTETKNSLIERLKEYRDANCLDIVSEAKANDFDLIQLGISIREKFNNKLDLSSIDAVVIENQISPLANRMKSLQGMIAQYFIMNDIYNIIFYSASNKLKTVIDATTSTTYKERKSISVSHTTDILENYDVLNKWLGYFSTHKKKDDLADSFLQGISFLSQRHGLKLDFK